MAMSLFTYIKDKLSILDVLGDFVQLKPAGHYWKGPCPFHSEKDASFTVSPEKKIFYCFGCHASGDVIGFIARTENLPQLEAAEYLADRYKLTIPQELLRQGSTTSQNKDEKNRYFALCEAVSEWAHKALYSNKGAIAYLQERHISDGSIKQFKLGLFPSGPSAINTFVKDINNENFLVKDLIDFGILVEGRSTLFSPFEERIIFPIKDSMGRFCGFGGRIFKPHDDRPKYYNSKESEWFEKGKILFGLEHAKRAMIESGCGFLVEGYMDCIMMHQHGYNNTVATLGTACTLEHLKILARSIHTLFVVYDGDNAGQKAMLRLTELCWAVSLELKIITLPTNQDPASFLSQGGNLADLITQAQDIVTFFISATGSNFQSKPLSQKLATAEKIAAIVARIPHHFKQDLLLHHAASVMQIPFSSLKELMLNQRPAQIPTNLAPYEAMHQDTTENIDTEPQDEILLLEEKILSAIISSLRTQAPIVLPDDIMPYFSTRTKEVIALLYTMQAAESVGEKKHDDAFLDNLNEAPRAVIIKAMISHDGKSCHQGIELLLARFYKHYWQNIVKDVKIQVVKAKQEKDEQKVQAVLEQFAQLKQGILQNRGLLR